MTAPARPAAPRLTLDELKAEERFWHREWEIHERDCSDCQAGDRCAVASFQADTADDYGRQVLWREEVTTDRREPPVAMPDLGPGADEIGDHARSPRPLIPTNEKAARG